MTGKFRYYLIEYFNGDIIITDDDFIQEYDRHIMERFEFENGEVLENVNVEYLIKGTPKYNKSSNICNIIVFCHGYDENCYSLSDYSQFIYEGAPFDLNKYLVVSITSLGFPGSCSPSQTGLKQNFPKYNFNDKVNFKRQFVEEKFGNVGLLGVVGIGMGGYEVYTWACEYPDDMNFIIVINSSYKTAGYRYVMVKGIKSVIEDNPNFHSGTYDETVTITMISVYKILFSFYFSQKILQEMSNDEIDVYMDHFVDKSFNMDIYDFKYQNDSLLYFNLEDKLTNIKSKALIISSKDDLYFAAKYDSIPLKKFIDNCQLEIVDFMRNKYDECDFTRVIEICNSFLEDFK